VHWRGLQRHEEYRRVFEKLFEELKVTKPDIIMIAGDIVHNKTQGISPELIDQLTWWFKEMVKICDVHVILGNHDGNLVNSYRQDAISPIINAIDDDRIFLYKESGTYNFAPGYNWCVFSVFDEEGWSRVKPVEGEINIALFHGSVTGSVTDAGWELESELAVDFFKDYDYVMLGDIHRQQFLDYREYEIEIDEEDLHKYPNAEVIS